MGLVNILLLLLLVSIEVVQFAFLKKIAATHTMPYMVFVGVAIGFQLFKYPLSYALLKSMDVGAFYATWSAIGIISMSGVAWIFFHEHINGPQMVSLCMIIMGIIGFYSFETRLATATAQAAPEQPVAQLAQEKPVQQPG